MTLKNRPCPVQTRKSREGCPLPASHSSRIKLTSCRLAFLSLDLLAFGISYAPIFRTHWGRRRLSCGLSLCGDPFPESIREPFEFELSISPEDILQELAHLGHPGARDPVDLVRGVVDCRTTQGTPVWAKHAAKRLSGSNHVCLTERRHENNFTLDC